MNDKEYLEKCDGLTFVPGNDGGTEIRFMTFHDRFKGDIETSNSGDTWYHVCFLKYDEENDSFEFDESFDAIFIDPLEYIRGLVGTNVYGTMVKKRQDSSEWFKDYLQNLKNVL